MPDLDQELLERVARWCAEAGRTAASAEIRRALEPLGWDELLAVRALLADPPPAQPLGPFALADLARGVAADDAAERERTGAYPAPDAGDDAPALDRAAPPAAAASSKTAGKRAAKVQGPVIRRARDAAPAEPPPSPAVPLADELHLPEGRAVLERLLRRHGARRHAIVAALAAGWRTADGRPIDDALLGRLLDHHGLARAFARRERDELLHALRAAGGLRAAAAARVGLDRDALDAALARTGASPEAERIREARRAELRGKATLAERVRLLLADPARLEDLGILAEVEEDLRGRLPEHVRAVGAAGGPLLLALARSLSIPPADAQGLFERLGVSLDAATSRAVEGGAPAPRPRARTSSGPGGAAGGMRTPRRPAPGRAGPGPRPGRGAPPRASGSFGPPRERRERSAGGLAAPPPRRERKEGFGPPRERSGPPRDYPQRPGGPRPGGSRPGGSRPGGPRPGGPRPGGSRPGGSRPGGSRPGGPRGRPPPRGPRGSGA